MDEIVKNNEIKELAKQAGYATVIGAAVTVGMVAGAGLAGFAVTKIDAFRENRKSKKNQIEE